MSDRDNITLPREVVERLVASWGRDTEGFYGSMDILRTALAAEPTKPSEEAEALRRDAERYRWLKAKVEDYDGHACFPQVPYPAPIPDRSPFDAVDAAIDAAMGEKR